MGISHLTQFCPVLDDPRVYVAVNFEFRDRFFFIVPHIQGEKYWKRVEKEGSNKSLESGWRYRIRSFLIFRPQQVKYLEIAIHSLYSL